MDNATQTNHENMPDTQRANLYNGIASALSRGSLVLLRSIKAGPQGMVRDSPSTFTITKNSVDGGRANTKTFTNDELRPLIKRELVAVENVAGIGLATITKLGGYALLHNY